MIFSILSLLCHVFTCWEMPDLFALVCGVLLWVCHFPIGILGLVWYLIVWISDLCTLTYFVYTILWLTEWINPPICQFSFSLSLSLSLYFSLTLSLSLSLSLSLILSLARAHPRYHLKTGDNWQYKMQLK